ncbi:MAG: DUF2202 domain-containing protein [Thiotrichales bacterium]
MKAKFKLGVTTIALAAVLLQGCDSGSSAKVVADSTATPLPVTTPAATNPSATTGPLVVDVSGATSIQLPPVSSALELMPMGEISLAERAGVIFLREEEKLASDLLALAASRWGEPAFANAMAAEKTHSEAVRLLMARHAIYDPAAGKGAGIYEDRGLQTLFEALRARIELSLIDALLVAAEVTEISLMDIASHAANVSDNPDILHVYALMTTASRNHLRIFVRQITSLGIRYQAQYLAQQNLEAIVASAFETSGA